MARDDVSFELEGVNYSVGMYAGSNGLKIFIRLVKILGEPLVRMMLFAGVEAIQSDSVKDIEVPDELVADLMGGLLDRLDPDKIDALFKEILSKTSAVDADGRRYNVTSDFDLRFSGCQFLLWKLVIRTARIQFSDFTPGFAGVLKAAKARGTAKPNVGSSSRTASPNAG